MADLAVAPPGVDAELVEEDGAPLDFTASTGTINLGEHLDEDPTAELRAKQLFEYCKLCRDLRIKEHTAITLRFSKEQPCEDPHDYDFSHTYLGDKQILPLSAALAFDKSLTSLNLAHTGVMDPGLRALCQQLRRSPRLEYVDLAGTRFSIDGAQTLLEMVKGSPRLLFVRMDDTCLDEAFQMKRGLPNKYARIRLALIRLFQERVNQESATELGGAATQKSEL